MERVAEHARDPHATLTREKGISLNQAAVLLIRRGAGLEDSRTGPHGIGDGLDEFIDSWSQAEEAGLLASIEAAEQVDDELWR